MTKTKHDTDVAAVVQIVGRHSEDFAHTSVLAESCMLAFMALMEKKHGFSPAVSVSMMEAAHNRAIERYTGVARGT